MGMNRDMFHLEFRTADMFPYRAGNFISLLLNITNLKTARNFSNGFERFTLQIVLSQITRKFLGAEIVQLV
jgi:hypothetical protein